MSKVVIEINLCTHYSVELGLLVIRQRMMIWKNRLWFVSGLGPISQRSRYDTWGEQPRSPNKNQRSFWFVPCTEEIQMTVYKSVHGSAAVQ
jgi:hypothetical protein